MRRCNGLLCACAGVVAALSLLLVSPIAAQEGAGEAAGFDASQIEPPASLAWLKPAELDDERAAERLTLSWAQVRERVEPAPLPKPDGDTPAPPLPAEAVALLERADAEVARGAYFRAIQQLRLAEQQAPNNLRVLRRLGVAYTLSGNRTRGADYLARVLAHDHQDAGALVLLAQHAASRGELAQVLGLCKALMDLGRPGLADLYRAEVLDRRGYTRAAVALMDRVLKQAGRIDPAQLAADESLDPLVLRELKVLKTLEPELRIRLGDLLVKLGDYDAADAAYAQTDQDAASFDLAQFVARRAYLALKTGQPEAALAEVVKFLSLPAATVNDAALVDYLVEQGVSRERLAERLAGAIEADGGSLVVLSGLIKVAPASQASASASVWLSGASAQPNAVRQVMQLLVFEDREPAHAQPLAKLMVLVADRMRDRPAAAGRFATALAESIDARVCLLRALKRPAFAETEDAYRVLLSAVAFERAGRIDEAIERYQRATVLAPDLMEQVRLPLASLMIDAGRALEALRLVRAAPQDAAPDAGWDTFELTVRAMSANGDHADALALTEAWMSQRGDALRTRLLYAQLTAEKGDPQAACEMLWALAQEEPTDERAYALGLELIELYIRSFRNISKAFELRRQFLDALQVHLPNSTSARLQRAIEVYDRPDEAATAEQLLLAVLEDEPTNTLAWELLLAVYEEQADDEKLDEALERRRRVVPVSVQRSLSTAGRAIGRGEMKKASAVLRELIELDREGVVPGPSLTGDEAASLLTLLSAADPDFESEPYALAMVKRFPNNSLLNNALGYRWAVEGKNLLQAKAMIERALKDDPNSHAVLDSMAWVHYKLGQFEQAKTYQERALEFLRQEQLRNNDPMPESKAVLYDHMGDILFRTGDPFAATRRWQMARAQRLDPEQLIFDPELLTLGERVRAKIEAVNKGEEPPLAPVPGPDAHGPAGHPADQAKHKAPAN